ncbi:hypothetical protein BCR34DRAFT_583966 [Clohesyomyces aquaticus]|uniref:Uncharacterized protein n=1 Tax=Clohesyomyces aquaticus TaxID=1231657 RepID=A0A1Y2A3B7_9PLEO|nr:hypothetical protein BCR34DRAFT_583966 [Clohesyomyces aquaticus]
MASTDQSANACTPRPISRNPVSQLQQVRQYIQSWPSMSQKLDLLPPNSSWTFSPIGSFALSSIAPLHPKKLFLGSTSTFEIWAYLKIFPTWNTGAQVFYVKETLNSSMKEYLNLEEFFDVEIMYPFKVYQEFRTKQGREKLNNLVLYLFLETGTAERVYVEDIKNPMKNLKNAVNTMKAAYEQMGGVEKVADTYRPKRAGFGSLGESAQYPSPIPAQSILPPKRSADSAFPPNIATGPSMRYSPRELQAIAVAALGLLTEGMAGRAFLGEKRKTSDSRGGVTRWSKRS